MVRGKLPVQCSGRLEKKLFQGVINNKLHQMLLIDKKGED